MCDEYIVVLENGRLHDEVVETCCELVMGEGFVVLPATHGGGFRPSFWVVVM